MSPIRTRAVAPALALAALVACGACGGEPDAVPSSLTLASQAPAARALHGRWEKPQATLPPVTLELRAPSTGAAGVILARVWLSGVTYEAAGTTSDSGFVLGADKPTLRGTLTADGRLRVQFLDAAGAVTHEETLVRTS